MAKPSLTAEQVEALRRIYEQLSPIMDDVANAERLVGMRYARREKLKSLRVPESIMLHEDGLILEALKQLHKAQKRKDALWDVKNTIAPNTMWWDIIDLVDEYESTEETVSSSEVEG